MNLSYSGTSGTIAWLAKLGPLMNSTQSGLPCAGRALGQFDSSMSPSCCCMALTTCFGSSPLNSGEPVINSPIMQSMLQTSSFSKYRGPSKRSSTATYNNCTRVVTRDIYHLRDARHRRCACTRERAAKVCDLQRGATPRVKKDDDVVRLHIPMHQAESMHVRHSLTYICSTTRHHIEIKARGSALLCF